MGVGAIVRDSKWNVFAYLCIYKPYIADPTIDEAYAVWKVVEFSRDLGFQNFIIEGDALEVVHALRKEGRCCMLESL